MSDRDLPENGTAADEPLSFDEGVSGISDLLDPDTLDLEEETEAEPAAEASETETDDEDTDEVDELDDDVDEDDDAEESDEEESDEDEDDEQDEDVIDVLDAEVVGPNGQTMTVRELQEYSEKRAADFQRDYTQKQEALKGDREIVETERQQVHETAQILQDHRNLLLQAYQRFEPKTPDPALLKTEPALYLEQKEAYEAQVKEWQGLQLHNQHMQQQAADEEKAAYDKHILAEKARMVELEPKLKDEAFSKQFAADASEFLTSKGAPEGALTLMDSAWQYDVLRDAIAYRKLMKKAPKTKEKLKGKPKVLRSGKRQSAEGVAARSRQNKAARLRETGSLEAGAAALEDFDL